MAALSALHITSQPEKGKFAQLVRGVGVVSIWCDNTVMQDLRSNSGKD